MKKLNNDIYLFDGIAPPQIENNDNNNLFVVGTEENGKIKTISKILLHDLSVIVDAEPKDGTTTGNVNFENFDSMDNLYIYIQCSIDATFTFPTTGKAYGKALRGSTIFIEDYSSGEYKSGEGELKEDFVDSFDLSSLYTLNSVSNNSIGGMCSGMFKIPIDKFDITWDS